MYFTEEVEPRLNDYDTCGSLSYEAILQILENVSAHHALTVRDRIADSNVAWILLEWRIEICKRPKQFQKIEVRTWVQDTPPSSTTLRDFLITDLDGSVLVKASSRFAQFNTKTKRMTRISEDLLRSYEPETDSAFEDDPARLAEPGSFDSESPIVLRRTDIDYNGHVHNTRYVAFALDALPEEEFKRADFDRMRIAYRSAISFGSRPTIRHTSTENGHFFSIYSDDRLCTMIELTNSH